MTGKYQSISEFEAAHVTSPVRCVVADDKALFYALNDDGSIGELLLQTRVSGLLAWFFVRVGLDVDWEWT